MSKSPLHVAVDQLDFAATRRLLRNGFDVNAPDEFGQRPLHFAVDAEAEEANCTYDKGGQAVAPKAGMTQLLLEYGANPQLVDNLGQTPIDWAHERNHQVALELLLGS